MPNVTVWDEANDCESFALAFALLQLVALPGRLLAESGIHLG